MAENTRIKININTGEFEVEGSEDFVNTQISALPEILKKLSGSLPKLPVTPAQTQTAGEAKIEPTGIATSKQQTDALNTLPDNFGEWYNKFPKKITQSDLVLIAGYFQQKGIATDSAFETSEVNDLLKVQGIKVANAAVSLKSLQDSKYVIIIEKRGKLNRFRISPDGESHIRELLQAQ